MPHAQEIIGFLREIEQGLKKSWTMQMAQHEKEDWLL